MSIPFYNIAIPISRLIPVVDFAEHNEKTFQQPRMSTPKGWRFVGRSFDLRPSCCILGTAQNPSGNAKSLTTHPDKVRAMSFLTTRDLHENLKGCPRYNGVVFRLDNPKVNYKSLFVSKKCRDIKEQLCTK